MSEKIWKYLINAGMTEAGAAGMMGNLQCESGLIANKVDTLCLKRLAEAGKYYTDATYTAFVDDGTITKEQFLHPLTGKQYGYGLAQWTSPSRKEGLYDLCKERRVSIGDLNAQLEYLVGKLRLSYTKVWEVLTQTHSVKEASDIVLTDFEQPADTGNAVKQERYDASMAFYKEYAKVEGMTETQAIDKVIGIAEAEEGYLEKKSARYLDSKTANAGTGNYTKYGKEMHALQPSNMDYPAAWCDSFVDWCFYKAFGADLARKMLCGDFGDYTINSANYYKQAGRWTTKPKRGYQVFFQNPGICHTGLVLSVKNGRVYTIEGNSGNAVKKHDYAVSDSYIAGYGMPRYDLAATEPDKEPEKKPDKEPEKKPDKKPDTGTTLNTIPKWVGRVTASVLNVRTWAGTEYPNIKSYHILKKGNLIDVCDTIKSSSGDDWYYIRIAGRIYGFVMAKYIKKV